MQKSAIIENLYSLIREYLSPRYTYHGIHHTKDVHDVCKFYIEHYGIAGKEAELLEIAAVGHDLGFIEGQEHHEQRGARIVIELMADYGYCPLDRSKVRSMILSTVYPQTPKNFLEEILCDADLDYLGRQDFEAISTTLKEEWRNFRVIPHIEQEFELLQIKFLQSHQYHTEYARQNREPVKCKHLKKLIRQPHYLGDEITSKKVKLRASA